MNKKTLILLCDNYPVSSGEFFIDDEMRVIADKFENIIVITNKKTKSILNRYIPVNMAVASYNYKSTLYDKFYAIPYMFSLFFINELLFVIKKHNVKKFKTIFKIIYMDLTRAIKLKKVIKQITKQNNISNNETIYYSYWHDYKSLTLALLKIENRNNICISRAHGWDIFSNRQNPPYLPFKKFIISRLNQTFSVSNAGKLEFQKLLNNNLGDKVAISKLGKTNTRIAIVEKQRNSYLFCSCSNLIPLKRVNLIIDILSKFSLQNIKWIHFGEGVLQNELEQYAKANLKNIDFCFKGIVPNSKILDFYNQNYVDLFINVSESEGIPVSVMEALSAGIPVIATNVGGTNEIVNNEIGFLIEKDFKINEAVMLIENYLNSPIENQRLYRESAYAFWKENYDAEINYSIFVEKLLKL